MSRAEFYVVAKSVLTFRSATAASRLRQVDRLNL
jgi:hypothetical protein